MVKIRRGILTQTNALATVFLLLNVIVSLTASAQSRQQTTHKSGFDTEFEKWLGFQDSRSVEFLLNNISPSQTRPGTVIASPSRAEPDYFFHWVRDAALVMTSLMDSFKYKQNPGYQTRVLKELYQYADLEALHQSLPSPAGFGEPKYNVDGSPFTGPWGRPQNDGPALRAIALMKFSRILFDIRQAQYVITKLYNPQSLEGVIKRDLYYVAQEWQKPNFDLWEEVYGQHFYTLMAQRRALLDGAQFAASMGDRASAEYFQRVGLSIQQRILTHLDQRSGYIQQTVNRQGGMGTKHSGLDAATVLAILHSSRNDNYFNFDSSWVMRTVQITEQVFKNIYNVNQQFTDLGTAIGRYPEDSFFGGNPWFLCTFAFAEYHYKVALYLLSGGRIVVDDLNRNYLESLLARPLQNGTVFSIDQQSTSILVTALQVKADRYAMRGGFHAGRNGSLSEQYSRFNGYMLSARDLTWSYASFLTMNQARMDLLSLRNQLRR